MKVRVAGLAAVLAVLLAGCSATDGGRGSAPGRPVGTGTTRPAGPAADPGQAPAQDAAQQPAATPARAVAAPFTPCARHRRAKEVFVSLRRQHLWLCAKGHDVRDTPITSGMAGPDTATPTGRYHIQGLNRNSILTLNTGATYPVKYWIPFDAPLFGFHDSSWQHFPYGSPAYRTRGSHGCVHVPLRFIRYLYGWADIGTPVTIRA
jgi:lipoprotein-anchoring transpeptidase ErfK/SrfK